MANRAYFINSSICSNSIEELQEKDPTFNVVATGSNRIPVPWFFGFDQADLMPAEFNYETYDGEQRSLKFQAPCARTEKVLSNLIARKSLFIEFCEDEALGTEYWAKAVADIQSVALPYLSLHPLEVLFLNNPEEEAIEFNKSFTGTCASFPSIELLSFYQKGHLPYSLIEFYANPSLQDEQKRKNSAAFDMGIQGVDTSSWVPKNVAVAVADPMQQSQHAQTKKPWWKIW